MNLTTIFLEKKLYALQMVKLAAPANCKKLETGSLDLLKLQDLENGFQRISNSNLGAQLPRLELREETLWTQCW